MWHDGIHWVLYITNYKTTSNIRDQCACNVGMGGGFRDIRGSGRGRGDTDQTTKQTDNRADQPNNPSHIAIADTKNTTGNGTND